jgi:hypothetical protein
MAAFDTSPIRFAEEELRSSFETRPFKVHHNLEDHPLFQVDALLDAGDRLPRSLIECNAGDVPISLPEGKPAGRGLTHREIFRLMPQAKVWLGLKKIDLLPEYREVIHTLLASIEGGISRSYPGMYNLEGYLFISSPGTVVPYHMDPEHNFLLQIRGDKSMYLLDRNDPMVLREEDLERYYTNTTRRMVFDPAMHQRSQRWNLEPGAGMHVPINFPHYVETGRQIAISLSATFDTPRQQHRARVYKVNYYLRKIGLKPAKYGTSALSDRLKSAAGAMYQKLSGA